MQGFKTHLETLITERTKQTGMRVTQAQIHEATGISAATLSRWGKGAINQLDYETVRKLMDYFGCEFNELVTVEKSVE